MGTASDDTDDPLEAPDGRIFGTQRDGADGEVQTQLLPEDATDLQKKIIRVAIENPSLGTTAVKRRVDERYFDGDEDEGPSVSTVWRALDQYETAPRPDGRTSNGKSSATEEESPTSTEEDTASEADTDEEETVRVEVGNVTYEGPTIDGTAPPLQGVHERPVKGAPAAAEESEGQTTTRTVPLAEEDFYAALDNLARLPEDEVSNETLERFAAGVSVSAEVDPREATLTAIRALARGRGDNEEAIRFFASFLQREE